MKKNNKPNKAPKPQDKKELEQVNDLIRIVNQVNTTSFKGKLPLHVPIKDVGGYTVGLMDTRELELLSVDEMHIEIIDSIAMSFYESPAQSDYIKEHCDKPEMAISYNVELDKPLSDGTRILYVTAFMADAFHPAVIAQLDRKPKYYAIVGKTLEETEDAYLNREYKELAGDE